MLGCRRYTAAVVQVAFLLRAAQSKSRGVAALSLVTGVALLASSCGMIQVPQGLPFVRGQSAAQQGPGPPVLPTVAPPGTVVPESLPDPAPYALVQTEQIGDADRVRFQIDIVLLTEPSREELIATLADAVLVTFEEQPAAEAVVVFAYTRPETVRKMFDTGRALASRDRRGWRGESSWVPFVRLPDRGKIHITLGSALTQIEEVEVDFE